MLLIGIFSAMPALSQSARVEGTVMMPEEPARRELWSRWGLADAVIHGDTIWLSGVIAFLEEGETDPRAAYRRAFERIGATLKRAGASWDDVVEMTTYHTQVSEQMPAFLAVKRDYVKEPFPAWTAVDVDRLTRETGLVEIKVIARRPRPAH